MSPTPISDRLAAIAALEDRSPFAQAFWAEVDPDGDVRADAIARHAAGAEVTQ